MNTEISTTAQIIDYLNRHGHYSPTYHCQPRGNYVGPRYLNTVEAEPLAQREAKDDDLKKLIPPLLWAI